MMNKYLSGIIYMLITCSRIVKLRNIIDNLIIILSKQLINNHGISSMNKIRKYHNILICIDFNLTR